MLAGTRGAACSLPAGASACAALTSTSVAVITASVRARCMVSRSNPCRRLPGAPAGVPDASARRVSARGGAWSAPPARAPPAAPSTSAALVGREPVAVHIHDVHVAGAYGDALFDDARAFVHQRVQQPVENFLIGDLTALDAKIARYRLDQRQHCRVRRDRKSVV